MHMNILQTATLFTTAKIWRQPIYPLIDEWINKDWKNGILYICTIKKERKEKERKKSAIKKKEILPCVTTWMDLKGIILNQKSQTEKDKYHTISLICGIKKKRGNE